MRVGLEDVRKNGNYLKYVLREDMTEEMCMVGVRAGASLFDVPEEYRNEDIYVEAVKYSQFAFDIVDEKQLTERICMEAVRHDGMLIERVPENLRTKQVVEKALETSPMSIRFVVQDKDNCKEAVKRDSRSLSFVDPIFITREMCQEAEPFFGMERFVPREFMSDVKIDEFYESIGYVRLGPFVIEIDKFNGCSRPKCWHGVYFSDGKRRDMNNREISILLSNNGLVHPHFV